MKLYTYEGPATVGLLSMFVFSGISKIFSENIRSFDIKRIVNLGISSSYAYIILILAGLFELYTSGIILYDVFGDEETRGRLSKRSEIAIMGLILFTLLVTLMFYVFPPKFRPLFSNLSTISGLFFVLMIIKRNQIQFYSSVPNETIIRVDAVMKDKLKSTPHGLDHSKNVHGNLPVGKSKC